MTKNKKRKRKYIGVSILPAFVRERRRRVRPKISRKVRREVERNQEGGLVNDKDATSKKVAQENC